MNNTRNRLINLIQKIETLNVICENYENYRNENHLSLMASGLGFIIYKGRELGSIPLFYQHNGILHSMVQSAVKIRCIPSIHYFSVILLCTNFTFINTIRQPIVKYSIIFFFLAMQLYSTLFCFKY